MTGRATAVVLLAVVGAVAREIGIALLAVADTLDPPPESPRVRAERDALLYVPDCFLVDQR